MLPLNFLVCFVDRELLLLLEYHHGRQSTPRVLVFIQVVLHQIHVLLATLHFRRAATFYPPRRNMTSTTTMPLQLQFFH